MISARKGEKSPSFPVISLGEVYMTNDLKVDAEKLHWKKNFLDSVGPKSWSDYEAYARCLFYLGKQEESKAYFLEAASRIQNLISVFERNNPKEFARVKLIQANFYRIAGQKAQSIQKYDEVQDLLKTMLEKEHKNNQANALSFFNNLSYCYFFLEDYEQSIHYGKMVSEWFPISLGYAEGLYHSEKKRIVSTLKYVIQEIKREKSVPYDTGAEVSLWDWYEIGKKLL